MSCVECTYGFLLIDTDRGLEIQACGECTDHDDSAAAVRFIHVVQTLKPQALEDLYKAVVKDYIRGG